MYEDLRTRNDRPVAKAIVRLANHNNGKFETHFFDFVESVLGKNHALGVASQMLLAGVSYVRDPGDCRLR